MTISNNKLLVGAAGAGGGAGLNVDEVFNITTYTGNSGNQTITTGLDMTGEGGMTWFKTRSHAYAHLVFDTVRGQDERLMTHSDSNQDTQASGRFPTFTSTGFTLANDDGGDLNYSGRTACAWSFRQADNFFKIVTYTGDGTNPRTISHGLGSTPGMIWVKRLDSSNNWMVHHRGATSYGQTGGYYSGRLDTTVEFGYRNVHTATSTTFKVTSDTGTNANGGSYIAYLFAHHDDSGTFGATGDQDIISCGGYEGDGADNSITVDVGFEPQWLLLKKTSAAAGWYMYDSLRGVTTGGNDALLYANLTNAEVSSSNLVDFTSTGFNLTTADGDTNADGHFYLYTAIRRSTAIPTAASQVFKPLTWTGNSSTQNVDVGFPIDAAFVQNRNKNFTYANWAFDRLRGRSKQSYTSHTNAEASDGTYKKIDNNFGLEFTGNGNLNGNNANYIGWFFKRAPNFFDTVCYTGDGATNHNVSHNLGVSPEIIWIKNRGDSTNWVVWHKDLSSGKYLRLETTAAELSQSGILGTASVSTTTFPVGSNSDNTNKSSNNYIAYLFATVAGVSKVGSYTGNGGNQTIDCGFSSGASYLWIKRVDSTGNWYIWDTARGIISGNDPHLAYNIGDGTQENTSTDSIDPDNSGFIVVQNSNTNINVNNATYIFQAIA